MLGSLGYLVPELVLAGTFLLLLAAEIFRGRKYRKLAPMLGFAGVLVSLVAAVMQYPLVLDGSLPAGPAGRDTGRVLFGGMLLLNPVGLGLKVLFGLGALFIIPFSVKDFRIRNNDKGWGDYFSLLTAALLGLNLMVMAANLLVVFLSIEMVSLCSYVLAAYVSKERHAAEGGMKYMLFGVMSSAVMLYGISLLYGLTGTIYFNQELLTHLSDAHPVPASLAVFLILAGFGFKISMFPFHFWAPDVYEGASSPVVAFLSTLPKAAGMGVFLQFLSATGTDLLGWQLWLSLIAIITMTIGNFQALWQDNVKRMLAYSSIGHTGFLLMGLAAYSYTGEAAIVFYLLVYTFANIGALIVVGVFANNIHTELISSYKGLGFKMPVISTCFVILLMSLIGLPPAGGFVAKLFIFSSAYEAWSLQGNNWFLFMLIAGAFNTVVALFYYLKIPLNMFLRKQEGVLIAPRANILLKTMVIVLTALTLLLGIFPGTVFEWL